MSKFANRNQIKRQLRQMCKCEFNGVKPRLEDVDGSAKVTNGEGVGDKDVENKLELPVIWVVALESMTDLVDEVRKH